MHASLYANNADALPPILQARLRANREDTTLPDSHGQIWTEIVTLSTQDASLFRPPNKGLESRLVERLGLGGRAKFPVRRFTTLWMNTKWHAMITRWCQYPIGQATFNISAFEWMASCRIDDVSVQYAFLESLLLTSLVLVRNF